MILSYLYQRSVIMTETYQDGLTSLCQQNVEKTMPTYVQGTVIPEISDLMYLSRESGRIGMLFRFHGSFEAGSSGWVSKVGMALDDEKNC